MSATSSYGNSRSDDEDSYGRGSGNQKSDRQQNSDY